MASGEAWEKFHGHLFDVTDVAINHRGSIIASSSFDGIVKVDDVSCIHSPSAPQVADIGTSGSIVVKSLSEHRDAVLCVCLSAKGDLLVPPRVVCAAP